MKTLILGASLNPERYAYAAANQLQFKGFEAMGLGLKAGQIDNVPIHNRAQFFKDIHTVTMYLGSARQIQYYQYILALQPKRIIFNPGAENQELFDLAEKKGIEVLNACTLVMLSTGQY